MDDENSYLVGYGLTPVPPGSANYPAGALWADPDAIEAAAAMRRVVEQPDEARRRGSHGRQTILSNHSVERTAEFLRGRLEQIALLPAKQRREESPVERAARYVAVGPSLSWTAPSGRFGRLGVFARKFLQRVLRPYLVRHREWESLVVDSLRRQESAAKEHAERLEQLEAATRALDQSVNRLLDRLDERVREPSD
jgi:hypothetical protein